MKFGKKLSISAFKELHKADKLDIIKNPKTGKLFVSANGAAVASVSQNYKSDVSDKEFVELIMEDDAGTIIWCLHNPNESANLVESL
jgi:hypothetical protein